MDKRVFFSMIAVMVISSALMAFKVLTTKECVPPVISFLPEKPRPGEQVKFISATDAKNKITWAFGDSATEAGNEATHIFAAAGDYTVAAVYDENCVNEVTIHVEEARVMTKVTPLISIPNTIRAGDNVTFSDNTRDASEWQWSIVETGARGMDRAFSTKFKRSGKFTLMHSLKGQFVNGDTAMVINVLAAAPVTVYVPPKPVFKPEPKPKPEPPKVEPIKPSPPSSKFLTDDDFATRFMRIANSLAEDDNASEDWKNFIVSQGCGDQKTMSVEIIKEGQETNMLSLERFKRNQIAANAYAVTNVRVIKRSPQNCIIKIRVTVQ